MEVGGGGWCSLVCAYTCRPYLASSRDAGTRHQILLRLAEIVGAARTSAMVGNQGTSAASAVFGTGLDWQLLTAQQAFRFTDADVDFDDREVSVLLRALSASECDVRRLWFEACSATRRRRQRSIADASRRAAFCAAGRIRAPRASSDPCSTATCHGRQETAGSRSLSRARRRSLPRTGSQ